jgi:hypothetical protein
MHDAALADAAGIGAARNKRAQFRHFSTAAPTKARSSLHHPTALLPERPPVVPSYSE